MRGFILSTGDVSCGLAVSKGCSASGSKGGITGDSSGISGSPTCSQGRLILLLVVNFAVMSLFAHQLPWPTLSTSFVSTLSTTRIQSSVSLLYCCGSSVLSPSSGPMSQYYRPPHLRRRRRSMRKPFTSNNSIDPGSAPTCPCCLQMTQSGVCSTVTSGNTM